MICRYVESAKEEFGVEPICATLTSAGVKIAPSTVYAARTRPPSPRARRDEVLKDERSARFMLRTTRRSGSARCTSC